MHNSKVLPFTDQIHNSAIEISGKYKKAEGELIDVLQLVDQHKVFIIKGYSSLYAYVVNELRLSESVAYNLITVSRKAREVPALKSAIQTGVLSLSNARKITPVLTSTNQSEWLEKASTLSNRQLEKEIIKVYPRAATPEKVNYVSASRVQLNFGLTEHEMLKLRRVQDLLSQSQRKSVSLEDVLMELTGEYLHRHDPIEKAKRMMVKKGDQLNATSTAVKPVTLQVCKLVPATLPKHAVTSRQITKNERVPIPASLLHRVNLRDHGKCTHPNEQNIKCNQSRFIDIHHLLPVSQGGLNTIDNLTTLCSAHHQFVHRNQ